MSPRTPSTPLPAVGDVYASTDARDVPGSGLDPSVLYVVALPGELNHAEVAHHTVVTTREAWGGGMVEFLDPVHGGVVGCAGIEWWKTNAVRADAFLQKVRPA